MCCIFYLLTRYLMTIVMFALALTIYEIFASQIKFQKFDFENEGQGHGGHAIRMEMFDST